MLMLMLILTLTLADDEDCALATIDCMDHAVSLMGGYDGTAEVPCCF